MLSHTLHMYSAQMMLIIILSVKLYQNVRIQQKAVQYLLQLLNLSSQHMQQMNRNSHIMLILSILHILKLRMIQKRIIMNGKTHLKLVIGMEDSICLLNTEKVESGVTKHISLFQVSFHIHMHREHQEHQELRDFRQLHRVQDLYMLMILHEKICQ